MGSVRTDLENKILHAANRDVQAEIAAAMQLRRLHPCVRARARARARACMRAVWRLELMERTRAAELLTGVSHEIVITFTPPAGQNVAGIMIKMSRA